MTSISQLGQMTFLDISSGEKKSLVNENVTSKYNFGMKSFQAKIENKNELDSLICPSF